MARYTGAVCRFCRREGMKLFLKGERCYTDKCALTRRKSAPGMHGQSRKKFLLIFIPTIIALGAVVIIGRDLAIGALSGAGLL